MSSDKVTFNELPEAGEVKPGDFFIIEDLQQTKKINNMLKTQSGIF